MREAGGRGWRGRARPWLLVLATGCGAEPVEARAIWVDDAGGEGRRRIHVYDRGELESFEVLGESDPIERVLLDPRGRGVLVRTSDQRGVWFDLDDGRRLPLLLPSTIVDGDWGIGFVDGALTWIDNYDSLTVVPLAVGLPLSRRDDGTIVPLSRGSGLRWSVAAERAPIVFAGDFLDGRASFFRYPTRADQPLVIALEAEAEGLTLPVDADAHHSCASAQSLDCSAPVVVDPGGELAMFSSGQLGPWQIFERRSPASAGPLELPPILNEVGSELRLLAALDRAVSIWIDSKQLYRYDRVRGTVDGLPLVMTSSWYWTTAEQGRAVILRSSVGPVYRADLAGLRAVSLETTECQDASDPVVSPSGRWLAWTCVEPDSAIGRPPNLAGLSSVVVRISAAGLERYVGVSMSTLAIDDDGDLLLSSVERVDDTLDAFGTTGVPRTLFVLSGDGVLTRIDELEPAPASVLPGTGVSTYIQGVALAGDR